METQIETQILELMASNLGVGTGALAAILIVVVIWQVIWKGLALWKSAGLRQKWWFIAILLINTFGILEIFYIFFVAKNYKVEVEERSG